MATEEWRDAARRYSTMPEASRADYWRQLKTDQQAALAEALADPSLTSGHKGPAQSQPMQPAGRGCRSPIAAGCIGMIIGCILTIVAELAAVTLGIQAVADLFGAGSSGPHTAGRPGDDGGQATDAQPQPGESVEEFYGRKRDQEEAEAERRRRQRELTPEQPNLD